MAKPQTKHVESLEALYAQGLGDLSPLQDVLRETVLELDKEEKEKKKNELKELFVKAKGLVGEMVKAEKTFTTTKAKFDKELGKLVKQIQSFAKNEEDEEEKEEKEETND